MAKRKRKQLKANEFEHVVAIGASAGGLSAICDLIAELPSPLSAPIVIAIHANEDSMLTEVLNHLSELGIKKGLTQMCRPLKYLRYPS